jgi:hypothetical protein
MHHIAVQRRRGAILGDQRYLFPIPSGLVERLDRLAPRGALADAGYRCSRRFARDWVAPQPGSEGSRCGHP